MDMVTVLLDFCLCGVFLIVGVLIRSRVRLLQRYVIPAAVVGGVVGLVLGRNVLGWIPTSENFPQYANILIDVLFAGLFIGRAIPGIGFLARTAGAQAGYAYFNAFGQLAIGLMVVALFAALGMNLHPIFGVQLFVGYQGGPGVATAIAPMIEKLGWAAHESAAVGEACAIAGLVLAILVGVIIVNIGIARKLTVKDGQAKAGAIESPTFLAAERRKSIGTEIVSPEAASSLAYNFGFMAMAIIGGKLIVMGIVTLAPPLEFLPTFPFVLVAGILVQVFLQRTGLEKFVDRATIESLSFLSLDLLIISALIAIKIKVILVYAAPMLVMLALGLLFNLAQFYFMAPRVLPGAWFEKGLGEFGQNTGSMPQALLLLKMADPRFETDAAEALALKMFLFSPIITPIAMLSLPMMVKSGPNLFIGIYLLAMVVVLLLCRLFFWRKPAA